MTWPDLFDLAFAPAPGDPPPASRGDLVRAVLAGDRADARGEEAYRRLTRRSADAANHDAHLREERERIRGYRSGAGFR